MTTGSLAVFSIVAMMSLEVSTIPRYQPRFGRSRPVMVVLGDNAATETTDYVVPYGILAESGVAEVFALSTKPGPIRMRPALRFRVHATIREFDARVPLGADYVIVPNIYEGAEDEVILDWIRSQAALEATIVGICDGVPVLANAGLLGDHRPRSGGSRRKKARRELMDSRSRQQPVFPPRETRDRPAEQDDDLAS